VKCECNMESTVMPKELCATTAAREEIETETMQTRRGILDEG
jgi:hypothetical protein